MAIDMIENNELSALAPSRLGLNQFADESYSNYTGGEDFFNLFGSRRRKKGNIREQIRQEYANLSTDCSNIQGSIDRVQADMFQLSKEKNSLEKREGLSEMASILSSLKSKQIGQGCLQKGKKEDVTTSKPSDVVLPTQTPSAAVPSPTGVSLSEPSIAEEAEKTSKNKTFLYVGLGVVALIGIALIVRK